MSLEPADTAAFYLQELATALREQSSRLTSYGDVIERDHGAAAQLILLEGISCQVSLSLRGYTVRCEYLPYQPDS
jgi:hypothetical protein